MRKKLEIIRIWLNFLAVALTLFGVVNALGKEDPMPFWLQLVHNSLTLCIWICSFYSKYKDIRAMYVGMAILHFRIIFALFTVHDVFSMRDPAQEIYGSLLLFFGLLLNQNFISFLVD